MASSIEGLDYTSILVKNSIEITDQVVAFYTNTRLADKNILSWFRNYETGINATCFQRKSCRLFLCSGIRTKTNFATFFDFSYARK